MSNTSEIVAVLATLSDDELVAVLRGATEGRPALAVVHAVLAAPVAVGDAIIDADVTPDADFASPRESPDVLAASERVGDISPVPAVPVSPTGFVSPAEVGGYSPGGVPTFESVRDKVEQRFGTAQGMGELDRQTPAGHSADEQWEARAKAARERLDQIRKSLHDNATE
ncbi:hypothetical protein [Nocardia australiensis]|uniref:hypothetical protein n=1 Tax=Nocardia australiensis TaxID=2887191 RepID=UPI001D13D105|nr:hypothetical protein [Nocardia australiensis]